MVEAYRPETLKEAIDLIKEKDIILISGGTDLMVKRKRCSGVEPLFDKAVVFIKDLKELKNITFKDGILTIGSACTCSEIANSPLVPDYLKKVVLSMASPGIRNMATIGGNICNSSPVGDTLPALYALEASLILESFRGRREIPINKFIVGPGRNIKEKDEILREIKLNIKDFNKILHRKVGTRNSIALAKLSFMGLSKIVDGKIKDIRLAFGAVGPTIINNKELEREIIKKGVINKEDIEKIKEKYSKIIKPIDDQRSKANYRKGVCLNLLGYYLENLM
ncbi:xanthine dehydrogenase family protein subunit M [Clostridium botulinum C]|uniref:FAD binding domain-containing protein n=1 Tax=Clostridium botulinum TaxID=1491 RepID=UPI001E33E20B|nr:FAD binding domain-containing protein [Clostridium botulinum]MCD3246024.1 xanthine dehydrogenase family protein subunit M [Clostridium botulinum C]MCD3262522.1 xanthine dehydrogenase family protein subunit M [Clostridium botulinum C]